MPRKQIDRAALSINRERDLGRHGPAEALQRASEPGSETSVPRVEDAIEIATTPAHQQDDVGIESCGHAT